MLTPLALLGVQMQFHDRIAQLVYTFPEDAVTSTGAPFWSAPKRFPHALTFDAADPSQVCACADCAGACVLCAPVCLSSPRHKRSCPARDGCTRSNHLRSGFVAQPSTQVRFCWHLLAVRMLLRSIWHLAGSIHPGSLHPEGAHLLH